MSKIIYIMIVAPLFFLSIIIMLVGDTIENRKKI